MEDDNEAFDEDVPTADRLKKAPHAYRTISEVADELHVPQHVLRFWETRFPQVRPLKRGGGRRYYRPEDIAILKRISDLLYVRGYTIKGVQRVLRDGETEDGDAVAPSEDVGAEPSGEEEGDPAPVVRTEVVPTADSPVAQTAASDEQAAFALRTAIEEQGRLRAELRAVLEELDAIRRLLPF
ncbi:MerR family transcriptional regulator [Acidomonas methanolica]|uniref:Transcriptional regulator MerR n=1 Tax=Acidomonas methanolica NBRC 104435 TaxID=1231351 RepID=A0A023D406_ACIMT|nr:MerR family transcriptional regulator [Acidomonas methanolica]MBU2653627.1 MerR family transcriptional regulator [Acidomonas methanolica]TCS31579.1 MerR-like DNA binding protein [Acidomonas methanolica]GAJ28794.1 transcriptional regulator MerR [Acidomonas methanolica NBRC 104435]GBQ51644.1 MerR family transcriptional regulator [Acidomonas methanolica]GEK97998.1 MerR family transcriptional regulator [Acidomonas methanolica NBRC 104435]